MKNFLVFMAVLIPFSSSLAQREYLPTEEDLKHFARTKTYIVLNRNPLSDYNIEIQDAIKKYWDITEYEFMQLSDFEEKSKDENASFLYLATVSFEKDKSQTRYNFLCLSLGGDHLGLDEMKDIANIPLSFHGVDEDSYAYKLGTFIVFIQNHVRFITANPGKVTRDVYKHYNDNMSAIKGKTLYFLEEELAKDVSSEARIHSVYKGDVKIVEKEDIKNLIMSGDTDAVFLHKVGPEGKKMNARVYKILIGAGDSQFYYFDYHAVSSKAPDAFLEKDFKKLMKAQ